MQGLAALDLEGLGRVGPALEAVEHLPVHEALEVEGLRRGLDGLDGLRPPVRPPRERLAVHEARLVRDALGDEPLAPLAGDTAAE